MQQDAHEFLNFLINHINEIILGKLNIMINEKNMHKFSFFGNSAFHRLTT